MTGGWLIVYVAIFSVMFALMAVFAAVALAREPH